MTDTFSARQVDGGDLVGGEVNPVFAVVRRRPDGETFAAEGLRDLPGIALESQVRCARSRGCRIRALAGARAWVACSVDSGWPAPADRALHAAARNCRLHARYRRRVAFRQDRESGAARTPRR